MQITVNFRLIKRIIIINTSFDCIILQCYLLNMVYIKSGYMNPETISKICNHFQLGNCINHIKVENGGQHYMWHFFTDTGEYAVKQLSKLDKNYELSEEVASTFREKGVKAVCANRGQDTKYMLVDEQSRFLVYPWIQGKVLSDKESSEKYIKEIAKISASMHNICLQVPGISYNKQPLSQEDLNKEIQEGQTQITHDIAKAKSENADFAEALTTRSLSLLEMLKKAKLAENILTDDLLVCHTDVNSGNLIWVNDIPWLVDWEDVEQANRTFTALKTAYLWSLNDGQLFPVMLTEYNQFGGKLNPDHIEAAFDLIVRDELNWMMENVRRFCDPETSPEQKTKCSETIVGVLEHLDNAIPEVKKRFSLNKQSILSDQQQISM